MIIKISECLFSPTERCVVRDEMKTELYRVAKKFLSKDQIILTPQKQEAAIVRKLKSNEYAILINGQEQAVVRKHFGSKFDVDKVGWHVDCSSYSDRYHTLLDAQNNQIAEINRTSGANGDYELKITDGIDPFLPIAITVAIDTMSTASKLVNSHS